MNSCSSRRLCDFYTKVANGRAEITETQKSYSQEVKALEKRKNDLMKDDAEVLHLIYEKRLVDLESNEQDVVNTLNSRLRELDVQNYNQNNYFRCKVTI